MNRLLEMPGKIPALAAAAGLLLPLVSSPDTGAAITARRFPENPIIRPGMPDLKGKNINGPSLVRMPDWLPGRIGKYYLYFAHHPGDYIRLATADDLRGPWKIYPGGVLQLSETACSGHVASPDVHVDHDKGEIRMYFHGPYPDKENQKTFLATSKDGLHFTADTRPLGPSYFRVFRRDGFYYTITKQDGGGTLYRSADPASPFERGPPLIPRMRHAAMRIDGDTLWVFYSRTGDAPEQILASRIDMRPDWTQWRAPEPELVLTAEMDYEGVDLPIAPSVFGPAHKPVHQLRDPAIYEEDGRTFLLYSVAGERGIAIAELRFNPSAQPSDSQPDVRPAAQK